MLLLKLIYTSRVSMKLEQKRSVVCIKNGIIFRHKMHFHTCRHIANMKLIYFARLLTWEKAHRYLSIAIMRVRIF